MARKTELAWTDVSSSNVQSIAFDEDTKVLCVRFHNGGLYSYEDVDMEVFVGLVHAESVGQYLNNVIKAGAFAYKRWFSEAELLADISARRK